MDYQLNFDFRGEPMKNSFISKQVVIDDLRKSGLTPEDIGLCGWRELQPGEDIAEILGFRKYNGHDLTRVCEAILIIPYPNSDFARVRLYPPIEGVKYLQPRGISPQPYIVAEVDEIKRKLNKPVIITEGEKKTLCLIKHGYPTIGLPGVWQFKNGKEGYPDLLPALNEWRWKGREVYICFDSDSCLNKMVRQAEMELAIKLYLREAIVRIIRIPQEDTQQKMGVDDYIVQKGADRFKILYDNAKPFWDVYPIEYENDLMTVLAKMKEEGLILSAQIERLLSFFARSWKVKKTTLFKDFKNLIPEEEKEEKNRIVEKLEPWKGTVNGEELADEIYEILKQFVYIADEHYYTAITLWIFLTYSYELFDTCPMLLITSPTMRCGKTTLLLALEGLVCKSLIVSNLTPASAYRVIDKYKPTLLADEADTGLNENDELRGIFNAGHTKRTAFVIRASDKSNNFEPQRFNTYCPKAVALIGQPNSTWKDRSIIIPMIRKSSADKIEKLPSQFYEKAKPFRQRILKWTEDNKNTLTCIKPDYPPVTNDRMIDNWTPLLAIADTLGEKWAKKAREAMVNIAGSQEEEDLKIILLKDIKAIFERWGGDKIASKDLVEKLNSLEDRPWGDWQNGKGLTSNRLARLLRDFNIRPTTIRLGNSTPKGYKRDDFDKIFNRFIPPEQNATPPQSNNSAKFDDFQNATQEENVSFQKQPNPLINKECCDVAVQKGVDKDKKVLKDDYMDDFIEEDVIRQNGKIII